MPPTRVALALFLDGGSLSTLLSTLGGSAEPSFLDAFPYCGSFVDERDPRVSRGADCRSVCARVHDAAVATLGQVGELSFI